MMQQQFVQLAGATKHRSQILRKGNPGVAQHPGSSSDSTGIRRAVLQAAPRLREAPAAARVRRKLTRLGGH